MNPLPIFAFHEKTTVDEIVINLSFVIEVEKVKKKKKTHSIRVYGARCYVPLK